MQNAINDRKRQRICDDGMSVDDSNELTRSDRSPLPFRTNATSRDVALCLIGLFCIAIDFKALQWAHNVTYDTYNSPLEPLTGSDSK